MSYCHSNTGTHNLDRRLIEDVAARLEAAGFPVLKGKPWESNGGLILSCDRAVMTVLVDGGTPAENLATADRIHGLALTWKDCTSSSSRQAEDGAVFVWLAL